MNVWDAAPVFDPEVDFISRALILQHGEGAARAAVDHLNAMIDLGSFHHRDMWARVVHAIHNYQRLSSAAQGRVSTARELSQLAAMAASPTRSRPYGADREGRTRVTLTTRSAPLAVR
jgi:hypothetical protein